MKNFKTLLLIAVFTLGLGGITNAQKVGHINFEKLVEEMPQTKTLKSSIEKLAKTYQDEIEEMGKKLDAKMQKYTAEQSTQADSENEKRAKEMQQGKAQFDQARQEAYKELQQKQADDLRPIIDKAQKAIETIAAAKGIDYVFDASLGKGLLVKKGVDLYDAVKANLGF
jgi:outer membrane protein